MKKILFYLLMFLGLPVLLYAGTTSTNGYFYLPDVGDTGSTVHTTWTDTQEATDTIIKANVDHVADNTQAHSDYLINNGNDSTSGILTASSFVGNITGDVTGNSDTVTTNANLTGEVTSVGNAATITNNIVDEANMKISNAPTNDYVLTADSGATGGWKWSASSGGASSLTGLSDVSSATATAGRLLVADGTDWESMAISGDITIDSTGAVTIISGGGGETLAETLAIGADANDVDITSAGRITGVDIDIYNEMGTDGKNIISADGTVEFLIDGEDLTLASGANQILVNTNTGVSLVDFGSMNIGIGKMLYGVNTAGNVLVADGVDYESVGISGDVTIATTGAVTVQNDAITPDKVQSTGQTDEYCLAYEATGDTWDYKDCSGAGGSPGGADTQMQYNDGGSFGGIASFIWDDSNLEVANDVKLAFGTDADYSIQYDESVDDQLLIETSATDAGAITDPMIEILTGSSVTANQQVFGIAKGSQSSNTPIFTVDEDGDVNLPSGEFTVGDGSDENAVLLRFDRASTDFTLTWDDTNDRVVSSHPIESGGASSSIVMDDNTAGRILVADGDGFVSVEMSGDATMDATGAISFSGAGSGDVTGVGDCASGACLDGSSDGGKYIRLYDGDSNYTEINNDEANQSANLKWILPDANGTAGQILEIASVSSNDITLEWDDDGGGSAGLSVKLLPQQAKLPSSNPMAIDAGNNKWRGLFNDTTDECGRWDVPLQDFQGGTLQSKIAYTMDTTLSGTAAMEIYVDCKSDGDDLDADDFGTVNTLTATVPATIGDMDTLTDTSLNEDSCAQYDTMTIKACRDADGNDTAAGDLELRWITIYE